MLHSLLQLAKSFQPQPGKWGHKNENCRPDVCLLLLIQTEDDDAVGNWWVHHGRTRKMSISPHKVSTPQFHSGQWQNSLTEMMQTPEVNDGS